MTHNRHDPTQKQFANAILGFLRETIPNEWKTFPSQVEAKYQTTFASQQSQHMRNFGFSGNRGIENGGSNMAIKRHKPEEIVTKLRQVEVLCGQWMPRVDVIRQVQIKCK